MTDIVELAVLEADPKQDLRVWAACGADRACHRIPFADPSIARAEQFVGKVEQLIEGGQRPTPQEMDELGTGLFAMLFQDDALALFGGLPKNKPVTLAIVSPDARVLNLPWEYIRFPMRPIGPDPNRPLVRMVPSVGAKKLPKRKKGAPPRVLFVAAQPLDDVATGWERQEKLLRDHLALLAPGAQIDVVRVPTRAALVKQLGGAARYDVVHFVGHGANGELKLVDDAGHSDPISANDFALLLSGKDVRMAVLSACRSAAGAFDREFAVVAPGLVRSGVPAVLAMQYSVPALTATAFVGKFYGKLLDGGRHLDVALVEARQEIAVELRAEESVEWGVPVLYRGHGAQNPFA